MTKTWCVLGRHFNESNDQSVYEKVNPKTKKLDKINKGKCDTCGRKKSQIFNK